MLSLWNVDFDRSTRTTRSQVGEVFIETLEVRNLSFLPKVWLKVIDKSALIGGTGSRIITGIGGKKTQVYIAHTYLQKRGWYNLGPTKISSGDIFGIFTISKTFDSDLRLLVIPYMTDIRFFLSPKGMLPGGRALREKTLEVTPYAAGIREYVPGDPLRRIHWPSSVKRQTLIVKEFEKDPLAEVWIFIDAMQNLHIHSDNIKVTDLNRIWWNRYKQAFYLPPDTFEYAVSCAASLAKYYIEEQREVALVSSGQSYNTLSPERGERQLGKILETLAVLEPEGNTPIWALINSQVKNLVRGSTVIIVTPDTDETLVNLAIELLHRGLVPVMILLDLASFGGKETSSGIAERLITQGVYTFLIRAGDDMKTVLENQDPTGRYGSSKGVDRLIFQR